MAFAKLETRLGTAAARTRGDLQKAVTAVCDLFAKEDCFNSFAAPGYKPE